MAPTVYNTFQYQPQQYRAFGPPPAESFYDTAPLRPVYRQSVRGLSVLVRRRIHHNFTTGAYAPSVITGYGAGYQLQPNFTEDEKNRIAEKRYPIWARYLVKIIQMVESTQLQ